MSMDDGTQAKILIVDDKAENLHVMKRILSDLPVDCYFASSGKEALGLLLRHEYALAILDVQMPEIDGFELAELINNNQETEQIPIIFVTANYRDHAHMEKGYYVGAVDYLIKPFNSEMLLAKVKIFVKLYQQKLAANKILKQQAFILNEVTDGWWEWDLNSQVIFYSDQFKKTLGYEPHELPNKISTWQDLVNQEDLNNSNQLLNEHLAQGTPYQLTLRFRHREGHTVWMLCRGVCVPLSEEKRYKMIGTYTDITEIKSLEMQLLRSNKDLEQFAYITSHDLRAPLRGIESLIAWIEEDMENTFDEHIQGYFNKLKNRVGRMDSLINGILNYSRIGRENKEKSEIKLNELLENAIDLLGVPAHCHIHVQENLPSVWANDTQLRQVFTNLIGNAIKYHDKEEIQIQIRYEEKLSVHQFCVADNGPGIEAEYHEKIFTLFQTLQSRDKVESTGVGLTVVKKIIELYGGSIWLESVFGEGCQFYFTWPKKEI